MNLNDELLMSLAANTNIYLIVIIQECKLNNTLKVMNDLENYLKEKGLV